MEKRMTEQLYIIRFFSPTKHVWVLSDHDYLNKEDAQKCLADKRKRYKNTKWQIVLASIEVLDD